MRKVKVNAGKIEKSNDESRKNKKEKGKLHKKCRLPSRVGMFDF